ncbi:MAG TPA: hypothetical protein VGT03_05930 [Candidatus Acidoferrales bacterium]|nr:hypothetical protein [Candidatus Acidoferrales bacterium]
MKKVLPVLFILSLVSSSTGQKVQAAQQGDNQGREMAIAQMRRIANAMKACSEEISSKTELATYYVGPPTNLEWDVVDSKTVRSPFQGIVKFTLPERSEETEKAKHSKKLDKQYMDAEIYKTAYGHEGYYQYEFDLGNGSSDLVKVLFVDDKTKESKPVPSGTSGPSCWGKAALSANKVGSPK